MSKINNYLEQIKKGLIERSPLYLKAKIISKSPHTEIIGQLENETYKIRVTALPIQDAANQALCKFLKRSLNAKEVTIVSGRSAPVKLVRISL